MGPVASLDTGADILECRHDDPVRTEVAPAPGLSVHEFRTPMTVVSGYIRMLLKDRAGAITDQQRRLLEEAEKSCGRLSALLAEMSDLSNLEADTAPLQRKPSTCTPLLADAIAALPQVTDREIAVELCRGRRRARARRRHPAEDGVHVDPQRAAPRARHEHRAAGPGADWRVPEGGPRRGSQSRTRIGSRASAAAPEDSPTFDEWRGGCGLSLAVARRVIDAHGGALWSPSDGTKAAAALVADPMG